MPPKTLTPDHTWMRLNQEKFFQPFFREYLDLLKAHLLQVPVMDHTGNEQHRYYTCGQPHDPRNRAWKPFKLLEMHCLESGYDFLESKDMVEERIGRKLRCECDILRQ